MYSPLSFTRTREGSRLQSTYLPTRGSAWSLGQWRRGRAEVKQENKGAGGSDRDGGQRVHKWWGVVKTPKIEKGTDSSEGKPDRRGQRSDSRQAGRQAGR